MSEVGDSKDIGIHNVEGNESKMKSRIFSVWKISQVQKFMLFGMRGNAFRCAVCTSDCSDRSKIVLL